MEDYYLTLSGFLAPLIDPLSPSLLSNSLKSTSLRLSWEGAGPSLGLPYVTYSLQRRTTSYVGGGNENSISSSNSLWETPLVSPTNATNYSVVNLRPYSQYQVYILQHFYPSQCF